MGFLESMYVENGKVNRESTQYFLPSCGIRQGDPLFSYLFILMAKVLSWMMHKTIVDGSLKGITLNGYCPTLSYVLFADNAIFFLDGTIKKCQSLAATLNQYCFATSQAINLNKSGVAFNRGYPLNLKRNMAQKL